MDEDDSGENQSLGPDHASNGFLPSKKRKQKEQEKTFLQAVAPAHYLAACEIPYNQINLIGL